MNKLICLLLSLLILLPGCGTMMQMHRGPAIYGGVQLDILGFIISINDGSSFYSIVGPLICLIDFPLSLTLDTVLLPWSILKAIFSDKPIDIMPQLP